jgi:hypothetical protein
MENDVNPPDDIDEQVTTVLETLHDHLDEVASVISTLKEEDYGKHHVTTNSGATWTLKHEEGSVEWFRYREDDTERYLISTRSDPTAADIGAAMDEYPQFVEGINEWVNSVENQLSGASEALSSAENALAKLDSDAVSEARSEFVDRYEDAVDTIASTIQDVTNKDYGKFKAELDNSVWLLKYEQGGNAKYLKVDDTYVLGEYGGAKPSVLASTAESLPEFVASVDRWLSQQEQNIDLDISIEESVKDSADRQEGEV